MDGTLDLDPDLNDITVFAAVARALSFVEASRRLGVPRSSVSRSIARLENQLGVLLLQRTSRSVQLTEDGRVFLERCGGLLDEVREVCRSLRHDSGDFQGQLRVTATTPTGSHIIGPALIAFGAKHPALRINLRLTNANLDLIEEGLDLAFRLGPLEDSGLVARHLWSVPYGLFGRPDVVRKVFGAERPRHPSELVGKPAVIAAPMTRWKFRSSTGSVHQVAPMPSFVVDDIRVALTAVSAGLGFGYAPLEMAEGLGLMSVDIDGWSPTSREMLAVFPSARHLAPKVRAAVKAVFEYRTSVGAISGPASDNPRLE